ncbi:PE domain-containing protein [Mycobacterium sp. pUA109]|uniref:PPE family protein, SVP subgroup n=1 Tax=Mycobacterium sp. pUA109 TaxID=3238982 RepID=UPI00351BD176
MSFVTTHPEALIAAAGKLQGIGSSLAAQNTAAAAPTTGVVPAAADEVSALQATQFSAYGTLYQQISAQATAIHEMFVNTLGASAESYGSTEAANSAASSAQSGLSGLLGLFTGSASGPYGLLPSALSNGSIAGAMQVGNFGSAASDLLQLGSSGFLAPGTLTGAEGSEAAAAGGGLSGATLAGAGGTTLAGTVSPAGVAGAPAAVVAGVGHASSVGGLSVPPSWAGATAPMSSAAPAVLRGAGWTAAAPHSAPVTTIPAGMPSVASAGRGGFGFGTPRYGVKPLVMPKPAVI